MNNSNGCTHGLEPDYCDACALDREQKARRLLDAIAGELTRKSKDLHAWEKDARTAWARAAEVVQAFDAWCAVEDDHEDEGASFEALAVAIDGLREKRT